MKHSKELMLRIKIPQQHCTFRAILGPFDRQQRRSFTGGEFSIPQQQHNSSFPRLKCCYYSSAAAMHVSVSRHQQQQQQQHDKMNQMRRRGARQKLEDRCSNTPPPRAHFSSSVRFSEVVAAAVTSSAAIAKQQHSQQADTLNNSSNNKRKHFWTLQELTDQTERLLSYSVANAYAYANDTGTAAQKRYRKGRPLATEFFNVLEAWMEQSMAGHGIAAAEHAHTLLDAMLPGPEEQSPDFKKGNNNVAAGRTEFLAHFLTRSHYDVVLQAYAVSGGGIRAAEQAESLLFRMLNACRAHLAAAVKPGGHSFDDHQFANKRQQRKRQRMILRPPPEPTIKSFNIVLHSWAKSGAPDAAERATKLLEQMEEWNLECLASRYYAGCCANERSLVSLIAAWTHSRPTEAPERALGLLQEAMFVADNTEATLAAADSARTRSGNNHSSSNNNRNRNNYRYVQLDVAVFNAVIYAWVRSNWGRRAAVKAEEILQMLIQWSQVSISVRSSYRAMVKPTTRTYSMIVMAWAECEAREQKGDAAQRADNILMKMVQLYREGGNDVKPNSILFTTCIAAWSRAACNCPRAPERAEQLWELLNDLYNETGHQDADFEPSTEIGNAVISAWSRCTSRVDSVRRSLGALEKLKQASKADLISYNTVMDAMSKKGLGKDAMELLHWLEDASNDGTDSSVPVPDRVSYNSVLAALSRSNTDRCAAAEEAEKLLRKMETMDVLVVQDPLLGERKRDRKPDSMSYTAVINAWSRSDSPQKAQRAMVLVQDMIRRYEAGDVSLKPDVFVYTILIKACAHIHGTQQEKVEALEMAIGAMETLETTDFGPPNDVAYSTLMTAICRLSESAKQRENLLESVFRNCADRGHVSINVIKEMNRGGSRRLFRRLTNNSNQLNPDWSKNVAAKNKPLL